MAIRIIAVLREWLGHHHEWLSDERFLAYICISAGLVTMAGLMSGLTLGLMSLDSVELEVLRRSGTARQRACAARILPVVANQHRLLVTLLVCNAIAAEALPLFLDRLADPITAVIVSVTVVLLFGEIIPQAACSAYGLEIGAQSASFVRMLMVLTGPVNVPIAWVLDRVMGHRQTALFRRGQLKALVDIHGEGQDFGGRLTVDEVAIIKGALDLTHKTAGESMTPLDLVFMLAADAVLDESAMTAVLASGHSRIPVHRPGNRADIIGILLVKELILVDPKAGMKVSAMKVRPLPHLLAATPMYDMLKLFELGRSHMAVLTKPTKEALAARRRAQDELAIDIYSIEEGLSSEEEEEAPLNGAPLSEDAAARAHAEACENGACYAAEEEGPYARCDSSGSGEDSDDSDVQARGMRVFDLNFDPGEVAAVGIITIEDVLEELLGREIVDETDQYVDNLHHTRVNTNLLLRSMPPHLRRTLMASSACGRGAGLGGVTPRRPSSAERSPRGSSLTRPVDPMKRSYSEGSASCSTAWEIYACLPRALRPSNPPPHSVAAQLERTNDPLRGRRRSFSMLQEVQGQLDLLEPLLAAKKAGKIRFAASEGLEAPAPAAPVQVHVSGSKDALGTPNRPNPEPK